VVSLGAPMRQAMLFVAVAAGLSWAVLVFRALTGPEAHTETWWRAVAFLVMFVCGAIASTGHRRE
jgi:hypothetical protein